MLLIFLLFTPPRAGRKGRGPGGSEIQASFPVRFSSYINGRKRERERGREREREMELWVVTSKMMGIEFSTNPTTKRRWVY